MNFSGEDRKEVFFFFEEILKCYKEPVYYENLRGHVSKAPVNVRKYVLAKCRGDNFLEYFKRRKNYFNVEDGKISLKDQFDDEQQGRSQSNKSKKKNSKGKFVRRNPSFSYSSYAGALKGSDSNKNGEEYETIAVTYFRNRLIRKKKERLWAIEINELPKKVKRYLQLHYRQKVKNFLSDHSDKFVIDSDDETVSLAYVAESANAAESSSVDQESSSNSNQNSTEIAVDSEIQKASEYLECVIFFVNILKKVSQPLPVEKLGGYFSQARKELKEHVKINYTSFKYFFDDAPLIFLKNNADEISLSKDYRRLIKTAENLIKGAINGSTLPPEMTLKSHIVHIFKPHISSRRCSSILEQESSNDEALLCEDMAHAQDIIEEMLKSNSIGRRESEMSHVSTDEFFDNYLMRSTSRDSSISQSDRSRSISVGHHGVVNSSPIKGMEKSGSDTGIGFDDKEVMENTFLKCILTVELFCLEFMESEFNFIQNYENKAIDYFMEILDASSTKLWRLTSLQGTIGNNREIAHFMNKLYKGEKFVSFFEKHPQFEVDPPFVKVALFDKTNNTEDSAPLSNDKNVVKDLKDMYEISEFRILLKETYTYLYNVCKFCKDKDDVKIDRVGGILPKFPNCFNMIKSSKGQSLSEKIEYFLHEMMIFQFPKEGSLSFPYECFHKKCQIFFAWFEKINSCDPSSEFVSFSDFWTINVISRCASNNYRKNSNSCINLEECYQNIVDMIEEVIESRSELSYCELPKIIPENILFALTNGNYYSRPLISALLESGSFRMKDGKISLQKTSEDCDSVPPDSKDNEFIENLEVETHISEEYSDELYIENDTSNNLVSSLCSSSVSNKDTSNYSMESNTEFSSDQTPKILQTIENCETKETDSKSKESKPNLSFKDDETTTDTPLIIHDHNKNENHTSEALEDLYTEEESEKHMKLLNTEENLSSDILTNSELSNLEIETKVSINSSESELSSKAEDLVGKENEYVNEISNECYGYEDEVNSETDSPSPDSDALEKSSDISLSTPPPECEFEEYPNKNQSCPSQSGSINSLSSEDLNKQRKEFANDQIEPSCNLNLNASYIALLDEDSCTKHDPELETSNKNGVELNIEATKEEINISVISKDENLLNRKNSNDSDDTKTYMAKEQLHNSELFNKETITKIFEKSSGKNENLDHWKTSEQIEDKPFENDVLAVPDFSDTPKTIQSVTVPEFNEISESKELHATSKNTNIYISYSPEELFDTSVMKIYLNSENVSEERTHEHGLESEEKNTAVKVPFRPSIPTLTLSQNGTIDINVSRASSCNDLSSESPMQPIMAKVVLLTNSSCIALADLKKCKKNIYFLKYAFTCEHQDDCSECFSALQIGDEVSCYVPLTEISQKIWIAFLVNKDNSDNLSEIGIFDKLSENAKAIYEVSTKSFSISAQMKNSVHHLGCQTEFPKCDNYSQTDLNDDVDLYKVTKETSCQTKSVSLKNISVQTENIPMKSVTETSSNNAENTLDKYCAKCQMYVNGDINVMSESGTNQNSQFREITHITKNVSCQTFSTGQVIMLKHHPM